MGVHVGVCFEDINCRLNGQKDLEREEEKMQQQ